MIFNESVLYKIDSYSNNNSHKSSPVSLTYRHNTRSSYNEDSNNSKNDFYVSINYSSSLFNNNDLKADYAVGQNNKEDTITTCKKRDEL